MIVGPERVAPGTAGDLLLGEVRTRVTSGKPSRLNFFFFAMRWAVTNERSVSDAACTSTGLRSPTQRPLEAWRIR